MILLEVRAAVRRATKHDLFTGNVNDMRAVQGVKNNVTVFYLHHETKAIYGPKIIYTETDFVSIYQKMAHGLIGIITPMPNVITNEYLFDLVLREALVEDLKENSKHIKLNQIYYVYTDHNLVGPFYIDNSTTSLFLENLIAKKQIFVPNERQHFKKKELKKIA